MPTENRKPRGTTGRASERRKSNQKHRGGRRLLGNLYDVPHGRASVLFVLLAGVGVALLAGGGSNGAPRRMAAARGRLILRAALLLPLGLWLQGLDHGVLVILQYYALYFVFAALVLAFPDRWLLAGAVAALPGGALVYLLTEMAVPSSIVEDCVRMAERRAEEQR